jgi:phospholipid-binding lipoprotein MlaA
MASRIRLVAVALTCAVLGACATTPEQKENNDPFEPVNRVMFKVNFTIDKTLGVPVAAVYTRVIPKPVRHGIHNALNNLTEPVTFGNDILQGAPRRAAQTLYRFTINTTLGIGGLFDIAARNGVPRHVEDFGQTLGYYGVGEGPYLVLPLVGAAPPRDFGGHFIDVYMDPFYYLNFAGRHAILVGRHIAGVVDAQAEGANAIKQLDASADPYAAARSAYRQHREAEIRNGQPDGSHLPDITDLPPTSQPLVPITPIPSLKSH